MDIKKLMIIAFQGFGGWFLIGVVSRILLPTLDTPMPPAIESMINVASYLSLFIGMAAVIGIPVSIYFENNNSLGDLFAGWNKTEESVVMTFPKEMYEIDELTKKLKAVESKEDEIKKFRARKKLDESKLSILNETLDFLDSQKFTIKVRLRVFEYISWENKALSEYRKLSALDYTTGENDVNVATKIMRVIIIQGEAMKKQWSEDKKSAGLNTAQEILPRLNQILTICINFAADLENAEMINVLKGVRQLDAMTPMMLPEATTSESMKILQEFQERPLDRDLLFEHLRIKSLKEINDKTFQEEI